MICVKINKRKDFVMWNKERKQCNFSKKQKEKTNEPTLYYFCRWNLSTCLWKTFYFIECAIVEMWVVFLLFESFRWQESYLCYRHSITCEIISIIFFLRLVSFSHCCFFAHVLHSSIVQYVHRALAGFNLDPSGKNTYLLYRGVFFAFFFLLLRNVDWITWCQGAAR